MPDQLPPDPGDTQQSDPFADVDIHDPAAVARALAEVGMRAGARQAVLEHMHDRIGRALAKLDEATDALVTQQDLEERMAHIEAERVAQRAQDKRTLALILLAFGGIVVAAFVAVGIAVAGNTAARHRQQEFLDTVLERQEVVAICTRTEPTEAEIRECIADRLPPSGQ